MPNKSKEFNIWVNKKRLGKTAKNFEIEMEVKEISQTKIDFFKAG